MVFVSCVLPPFSHKVKTASLCGKFVKTRGKMTLATSDKGAEYVFQCDRWNTHVPYRHRLLVPAQTDTAVVLNTAGEERAKKSSIYTRSARSIVSTAARAWVRKYSRAVYTSERRDCC